MRTICPGYGMATCGARAAGIRVERIHRHRIETAIAGPQVADHNGSMTAPAAAPALHRPDGSALRVLVVDDEQMLTDLLSMALRMEGWEVRTAGSGFDALTATREFDPDALCSTS